MLTTSFNRLSTKGLNDLALRVLKALLALAETALNGFPIVEELKTTFEKYNEVVIKNRSSKLGEYVRKKDDFRDKMFRALRTSIKSLSKFSGTSKSEVAQRLTKIFDEVGNIRNLEYEEQNTVMTTLITRLDTPENLTDLAALGLSEEFAELQQAQLNFEEVSDLQSEGNALLRETPYASYIRTELEDALRNVFKLVSGMKGQKGKEWDTLYLQLEQYIKEAENDRKSTGKKDED